MRQFEKSAEPWLQLQEELRYNRWDTRDASNAYRQWKLQRTKLELRLLLLAYHVEQDLRWETTSCSHSDNF